jgi:uncharacterized membrane protein
VLFKSVRVQGVAYGEKPLSLANPRSTARIFRQPIHPMLVPIPIACFIGVLLTDLTYWWSAEMMWADFSAWLVSVGVIFAYLAAVFGLIDFLGSRSIRAQSPAWPHAIGNVVLLILATLNMFVHSRDPDYLTSVKDGAFYGWPYSYYGQHIDPRVQPQRPDLVEKAIAPDYALSSHVAPLGLVFDTGDSLPQKYRGGAFVGEHRSWDRPTFNGYRVVFVPFSGGRPNGKAEDVVTDFLNADGKARGRPVGLALDKTGALLIADDVGNTVWRVSPAGQ